MRTSYHNAQSGIRSVVYNLVEQVMLDLFRNDFIGEKFEAHVAKAFDTEAAADRLLNKVLTSGSFIKPIATVVRRKRDSAIAKKETVASKASKREQIDAIETHKVGIDSLSSRSKSDSEHPLSSESSKRKSKRRHANRDGMDESRHSRSPKSEKKKYDSRLESGSDEEE